MLGVNANVELRAGQYQESLAKVIGSNDVHRDEVMVLESQLSELIDESWRCSLAQDLVHLPCAYVRHACFCICDFLLLHALQAHMLCSVVQSMHVVLYLGCRCSGFVSGRTWVIQRLRALWDSSMAGVLTSTDCAA